MTRFDVAALVWAVLMCLALNEGGPLGLVAVLMFPGLLALAAFALGFLNGVAEAFLAKRRNRHS